MAEEAFAPDFDVGITGDGRELESWQSDHSPSNSTPDSTREENSGADAQDELARGKTKQQLEKILRLEEGRTDVEKSASPRRSKRQRLSHSRSASLAKESREGGSSKRAAYTCPSRIADIFDRKISTEQLCTLSSMTHGTPESVREIIPEATIDQICQMVKL